MSLGSFFRPATPLRAFARSRRKPVQKTVEPLSRWRLYLDEYLVWHLARRGHPLQSMGSAIEQAWAPLKTLSDGDLDQLIAKTRVRAADLLRPSKGAIAFALALEVLRRQVGFGLRQNQIACALALLRGDCVEMRTGEGKTLAAGLAALVAAWAGVSTHVITVNDYLAARDYDLLSPAATRFGLRIAVLTQDMKDPEKRQAYDVDILYGTNKTFVFDNLRDQREGRTLPNAVSRQMGQALAIVDEADSVLIDDATVPMILSEQGAELLAMDLRLFHQLSRFAQACEPKTARELDVYGGWRLTRSGLESLAEAAKGWTHPITRNEDLVALAEQALAARYNFRRGESYIVQDGVIVLIDQATGRLMPDRRWGYGMHQLVEIKEEIEPTPESRTVGQVTQQTYFRHYRILSGLTGTARECRSELWTIYRLSVEPIAPHASSQLHDLGLTVAPDAATKWRYIRDQVCQIAERRAVLIGVNDVVEAETLTGCFNEIGREVAVLDALSEAQEAELVAAAGVVGRITIATHLAGRGTDIALSDDLRAAGGLHVVIGSVMASGRLERQLFGRAGRQGDPGSFERAISLQDRGLSDGAQSFWRQVMTIFLRRGILPAFALRNIQAERDKRSRAARKQSLLREQDLARQLGYR
jgi:preprotein translocase subunit SecA